MAPLWPRLIQSRPEMSLPRGRSRGAAGLNRGRDGFFDYEPARGAASAVEWHVNFADPRLFFGYGTSLFAPRMRCRSPSTRARVTPRSRW